MNRRQTPRSINRRGFLKELGLSAASLGLLRGVAMARQRGGLKLTGSPKNVVILGGGLAGLSAGLELKRAGHTVTILEARKFPGGRVQTIRDFSDGLYAEAGPTSFPETHQFTMGYVHDFDLPIRPEGAFGMDQIGFLHNSRFRIPGNGVADFPFPLKPGERQAGVYALPSFYLGTLMRDVGNPRRSGWPPDSLREVDGVSLKTLLQNLGASDNAIDLINASELGILGFGIDSFSAMDGVVTEAVASGLFFEIAGGNDQLASALKRKVKKQFRKQAIVLRIDQNETGVTVTYTQGGVVQTISADRVICTLPFPVLKDIPVTPAFPEDKQRAINELKLTPVTRTYLQFRTRVWQQDRLDGFGLTDLPIQNTHSPTGSQTGTRGILASYCGGQRAIELGAMVEQDRQSFVLRQMRNLFSGLDAQYETGLSQIWHQDPWARGGFTYFEPGQMTTLLPIAQRPEGRIHFAGEHTSAWHGWMNGALESGNRAADEVNVAEAQEALTVRSAV